MNCQEVQLQLSGYLEKSLDAIRMKSVETHLSSCPFCRAEAHGLSECIRQIAELPIIEPPPGFAQRVMAHTRAIETEPRAWQRLFSAFRATVPIQAAAVVLVSVLAVVLYQKEARFKEPGAAESSAPGDTQQTEPIAALRRESASALKQPQEASREISPAPSTPETVGRQPRQAATGNAHAGRDEAKVSFSSPGNPSTRASEAFFDAPRRPPIQAQEVSTGRESPRPSADALGFGALRRQPFGSGPGRAERPLSPLSEPRADFEFVVRRRLIERTDPREEKRDDAVPKASEADAAIATAAAQRAAPSGSIVEIRWFNVAPKHLDQFRKELAAEATIDSEKSLDAAEKEIAANAPRDLLVKVIILSSER